MNLKQRLKRTKVIKQYKEFGTSRHLVDFKPINAIELYNKMPLKDKKTFEDFPDNFKKEHEKYISFHNIYTPKFMDWAQRIIIIGMGAIIEENEYKELCKNEVLSFIEKGYLEKLLIIGLKGNDSIPNTEETKDVKYRMAMSLGIKDEQIIREWIGERTPLSIPYSEEQTLILVLVDGRKRTSSTEFLKSLLTRRPNSVIDFFCLRTPTRATLKKELGMSIKLLCKWTQPIPPLFYYRIKNRLNSRNP